MNGLFTFSSEQLSQLKENLDNNRRAQQESSCRRKIMHHKLAKKSLMLALEGNTQNTKAISPASIATKGSIAESVLACKSLKMKPQPLLLVVSKLSTRPKGQLTEESERHCESQQAEGVTHNICQQPLHTKLLRYRFSKQVQEALNLGMEDRPRESSLAAKPFMSSNQKSVEMDNFSFSRSKRSKSLRVPIKIGVPVSDTKLPRVFKNPLLSNFISSSKQEPASRTISGSHTPVCVPGNYTPSLHLEQSRSNILEARPTKTSSQGLRSIETEDISLLAATNKLFSQICRAQRHLNFELP